MKAGIAGSLAKTFLHSRLTPLFVLSSIMAGAFSVAMLPREEEPQIIVPMIDIFVAMPGASAREVEERVTKPMEKLLWEIPGVEYIYSTSSPGGALAIVRFKVGEDEERSIVRLNQKMFANFDLIPPGASQPLIKPRSIDDVPILALTLHGKGVNDFQLRQVAAQLHDRVKQTPDVSAVTILGGQRRQLRVILDTARLSTYSLTALEVMGSLGSANRRAPAGRFTQNNAEVILETGGYLRDAGDVRNLVIGAHAGRPVYLRDVAEIADGGEEPSQYVQFGTQEGFAPAVTLAIAKRKGTNAIAVAEQALERAQGFALPNGIRMEITRHYGETAAEKSNELLYHMAIAVISVTVLIALTLGLRESVIVFAAIPVTLALTLTTFYLYGYTLNRITLFALIFSIGILVDDAIVVVENIVRHQRLHGSTPDFHKVAVHAVDEVGNPTILATLTVIAAILPMAFVRGLMGPYMRPIPIGASAAMVFSLLVAFWVTPYVAVRVLGRQAHGDDHGKEDFVTRMYRRFMGGLLRNAFYRWGFLGLVSVLLIGSMALVYIGFVQVKMLPFDNKSEFQIIIDMPEGTPLETTAQAARALAEETLKQPEVVNVQTYTGTASPYNFNGLVRHYYLRAGANVADIQVNLTGKEHRKRQSHEIAKAVRQSLQATALRYNANVKVAEVPPGPPVLQTLVAEIYGPDEQRRREEAQAVRKAMQEVDGIVDIDWYVEDAQTKHRIALDRQKAAIHGITEEAVVRTLRVAAGGEVAGLLHDDAAKEDVPLYLRLDRAARSGLDRLQELKVRSNTGGLVPLREVVRIETVQEDRSIYHKNLMPVTYVTADIAGAMEAPVYAILALGPKIRIPQWVSELPHDPNEYALKWDGEWHITYEVFRDLGLAFAAVLVLIYVLVVGWFQSFLTPLVIMSAIPFSLVGILPAHGLMNAFFTATSMIGFIAGAGIVVRNSIILVDFIELRRSEGMPLAEAVVEAGAVRFRPMMLTAAAVVVGSSVILFDPIFQGLAIALMAGEVASLLLSRMTVPVMYYIAFRNSTRLAEPDPLP